MIITDAICLLSHRQLHQLSSKVETVEVPSGLHPLYGCESWTLTADLERSLQAFKHTCYRRLLHISYTTQDEWVGQRSHQLRGQAGTTPCHGQVMETGLVWPHLPSGLHGQEHSAFRGRPMKFWLDNITDWMKQPTAQLLHMVEDQQRWHIRVAKASTRSPQLVSITG